MRRVVQKIQGANVEKPKLEMILKGCCVVEESKKLIKISSRRLIRNRLARLDFVNIKNFIQHPISSLPLSTFPLLPKYRMNIWEWFSVLLQSSAMPP